jgi:hypothetical protein
MFSICCGWWAIALGQAGRSADARALVSAVHPILLQPHNHELLATLKQVGLLAAEVEMPTRPPRPRSKYRATANQITDHGAFKTVSVRGVNALMQVESYRREFARGSGPYPFLIGDETDLTRLLESLVPPADGGRAALEQARSFDPIAWLEQHSRRAKPRWPQSGPDPVKTVLSQYDAVNQHLKPEMFIGLAELHDPWELFARIGYGDWNECPPPHVHTALHRRWHDLFGAEPIAFCNDVVECVVARPPQERKGALVLAREHEAYCADVVEQGLGSTGNLASSLLNANYWYFWWD